MSHQTGIRASDELRHFFATAKGGQIRLIKVSISDERLVLADQKPARSSWEHDYKAFVLPCIEENTPCYILFRLDSKGNTGFDWLFIAYAPDTAPVRQKMLYAATRATLKTEFGAGQIREDFHASCIEDVSFEGYLRFKHSKSTPGPMTEVEQELHQADVCT